MGISSMMFYSYLRQTKIILSIDKSSISQKLFSDFDLLYFDIFITYFKYFYKIKIKFLFLKLTFVMERNTINVHNLGLKARTMNEFYRLLTVETDMYLSLQKETSI